MRRVAFSPERLINKKNEGDSPYKKYFDMVTSYAPALRKKAKEELAKNYGVKVNDVKRVDSKILTCIDYDNNNNKYH